MRWYTALLILVPLAACSGGPGAYGITGPGVQPLPPVAESMQDATPATHGASYFVAPGTAPVPATGSSGFWGYNN